MRAQYVRMDPKKEFVDGGLALDTILDEVARRTAALVLKELVRPRLLTDEQAGPYLGFTKDAIRQRVDQFPNHLFVRLGKARRWDLEALDEWINSKREKRRREKVTS